MKVRIVLALVLVTAFSTAALAQGSKKHTKKPNSQTVVVAGRAVSIDPATGKLRQPTPAEARALAAGLKKLVNRSTEGLTVRQYSNGMKAVDLQGRFQSALVATRKADGSVAVKCVHGEAEANAAVEANSNRHAEVK
jgi:hypothetical protein